MRATEFSEKYFGAFHWTTENTDRAVVLRDQNDNEMTHAGGPLWVGDDGKQYAAPFRGDVTVNWVGDPATTQSQTISRVNPLYCATAEAAQDLAGLLSDIGTVQISEAPPLGAFAPDSPFTQSSGVPWITITANGFSTSENAGQMVNFFNHGYPPDMAAGLMRNQFTSDLDAQAKASQQ